MAKIVDIILMWYTNQQITSYELRVNILTSCVYYTSYKLLFPYELRVTVYSLSYELLLLPKLRVIFYRPSYELLFYAQVTSFFCMQVTSYFFLHESQVIF